MRQRFTAPHVFDVPLARGCRAAAGAVLLLLAFSVSALGQTEKGVREQRLALVIGNGGYKSSPLSNPVNDARAMAEALGKTGFTVIRKENASLKDMSLALREFGDRCARAASACSTTRATAWP